MIILIADSLSFIVVCEYMKCLMVFTHIVILILKYKSLAYVGTGYFYNFIVPMLYAWVNGFWLPNLHQITFEHKKTPCCKGDIDIWGGRRGSNPRMTGPQPAVLTTSPRPP